MLTPESLVKPFVDVAVPKPSLSKVVAAIPCAPNNADNIPARIVTFRVFMTDYSLGFPTEVVCFD